MKNNNPPSSYVRVAVDLGRDLKVSLINYALKRNKSVSDVIRELVSKAVAKDEK